MFRGPKKHEISAWTLGQSFSRFSFIILSVGGAVKESYRQPLKKWYHELLSFMYNNGGC